MSSSRQSRLYLSSRIVSMIRSNDQNNIFSAQELLHIENLLRDEFTTNQWLFNVCNAISDGSAFVTKHDCDLYEKCQTEGQSLAVSESEINGLQKKLKFLKEKAVILQFLHNDLSKRISEMSTNGSQTDDKEEDSRQTVLSNLNIELQESLTLLKSSLSSHFTFKDPKDLVEEMVNQLNVENEANVSPTDWLSQQLDGLALSHINKHQLLQAFNSELFRRLENLKQSLREVYKECHRIKDFYEINISQEMSWRRDLKLVTNQIKQITETEKITLPQITHESNDLSAKKQELKSNSELFAKIESQEFDEFQSLINALKERIEILQINKASN